MYKIAFIILLLTLFVGSVQALECSEETFVRCVLGEAEDQPFIGKVAVAEAASDRDWETK